MKNVCRMGYTPCEKSKNEEIITLHCIQYSKQTGDYSTIPCQSNSTLSLSIQEDSSEAPCCSSQIIYESKKNSPHCNPTMMKEFEKDKIGIDKIDQEGEYENYRDSPESLNLKKEEEIFRRKIKKENLSDFYEEHMSCEAGSSSLSISSKPEKQLKEQDRQTRIADFYRHRIHQLTKKFCFKLDHSIISKGLYDYRKASFNWIIACNKKMGIEVLNNHLLSFDRSLHLPSSFYHVSKNSHRRLFQLMIRKKINTNIRDEVFSGFIDLSLRNQGVDKNPYISWKKSIVKKISSMSDEIVSKISKDDSLTRLTKRDFSFTNRYLDLSIRFLFREIIRHGLFSIFIEIHGKLKNIFISRASAGYFLNKYSDCFLKEFMNYNGIDIFTKKMGGAYLSWRKLKYKSIKKIIETARPKFEALLKSDHKVIRTSVLAFENNGFRALTDFEFQGLIDFIHRLVDHEGPSGITERACRHFYKESTQKNLQDVDCNLDERLQHMLMNEEEYFFKENPNLCRKYEFKEKKIQKNKKAKINLSKEEKINCFRVAKEYHRLTCHFLEKHGKIDKSIISSGIYDYRYFRYNALRAEGNSKETEIEIMEHSLSSFDHSLNKDFFNSHSFSRNYDRRRFQEKLRKKINGELKPSLFLKFLEMSIAGRSEEKKESYFSWKEKISNNFEALSFKTAEEVFIDEKHQKNKVALDKFVNRYASFCSKSTIREILRHTLFSIPIKSGKDLKNFLIPKISVSQFFNRYSDYFLNTLLKQEKAVDILLKSSKLSSILYKGSKRKEICEMIAPSLQAFNQILENDRADIRKEVLVFEKFGFRPIADNEFQSLMDLIQRLTEPTAESFIGRAIRHFCREKRIGEKPLMSHLSSDDE